jgi:hypothetical protein
MKEIERLHSDAPSLSTADTRGVRTLRDVRVHDSRRSVAMLGQRMLNIEGAGGVGETGGADSVGEAGAQATGTHYSAQDAPKEAHASLERLLRYGILICCGAMKN